MVLQTTINLYRYEQFGFMFFTFVYILFFSTVYMGRLAWNKSDWLIDWLNIHISFHLAMLLVIDVSKKFNNF